MSETELLLTKKQRHEIYKSALNCIAYRIGLCLAISNVLYKSLVKYKDKICPYKHMEQYPEILKHKPEKDEMYGDYWFIQFDSKPRIKILKQAIKETS